VLKRKRSKDKLPNVQEIYARIRGFILDSQIDNPHELALALGCSKISEDVAEMEEDASDERIDKISYLAPLLIFFAKTIAEGLIESQRKDTPVDEIPPEIWANTKRLIEHTAISAMTGSVTQLVDLGLLEVPKRRRK